MEGYDEYEDLDEYEEDGEEQEEDEEGAGEEEEAPQPTEEELEYLELRQRLKETIRKQIKKESGSSNPPEKKKKLPYDNYGSFFGPSQPVIAQRVIQESKSLLENQHLAAKASSSHNGSSRNGVTNNKSSVSTNAGSKPRVNNHQPKAVNEAKLKVQKLKDTRDYSFLLSDDAELPATKKDPPPRNLSVPHSDARIAQGHPKSKQMSNAGKYIRSDREERKPMSTGGQTQQSKTGSHRPASANRPNLASMDSRKQLGSNNGSGPGRPLAPKSLHSKIPPATTEKRVYAPGAKSAVTGVMRPPSSKLHSSVAKKPLEPKKEFHESSKGKIMSKQPVPSSKSQIKKPPPKIASRATMHEDRPKKKPLRRYSDDEDDSDDGGKAISMIRQMFNYNPRGFAGRDDDDSDMEANFDDILREEKRSAKIAREEDEEELRKIEEEERRERLRKEAKKRKLSQR